PPPSDLGAPRLELLAKLGAIAGPAHRGRLPDRVREVTEKIAEQLGVLLAVRAFLEMPGDALALGRRKLPAQIRHEVGVGRPRHVSASPLSGSRPSSSRSASRGGAG